MISKNTQDTQKIAKKFLDKIVKKKNKTACIIGLYGELGTGKTTFTQYVTKELGIKKKVNSPTFVIMKRYPLKHEMFENFYHLDAYRLKNEQELLNLGWKEILSKKENIVFIEWPENIKKAMPKKHHKIKIKHLKTGHREIKIS